MFALPADTTAVTRPVVLPTFSMAVLLLLHNPPAVRSDNIIPLPPRDTDVGPRIAVTTGVGFTVTNALTVQTPAVVYLIVVVPGETPVTPPDAVIVATAGVLLFHEAPGVVASDRNVTEPVHTDNVPDIGSGVMFTLIGKVR